MQDIISIQFVRWYNCLYWTFSPASLRPVRFAAMWLWNCRDSSEYRTVRFTSTNFGSELWAYSAELLWGRAEVRQKCFCLFVALATTEKTFFVCVRQRHNGECEHFACFTCILCSFSWHICYVSFCIYLLCRSYLRSRYGSGHLVLRQRSENRK